MFPTTSRVTQAVYESLVGAFYPELVTEHGDSFQFGTGTRNVHRREPHGFRYICWQDANKRAPRHQRTRETTKAIEAAYQEAIRLTTFLPVWDTEDPAATPGQLVMTNTNHQRSVLASTAHIPEFPLDLQLRNPRYSPGAPQAAMRMGGKGPKGTKGTKGAKGAKGKITHSEPEFLRQVPFRVENTVKLAGATAYRSLLMQCAAGFLTGQDRWSAAANFEAYARANVGLSRAIGSTVIVSPLDMRGLIGMAQVVGTLQGGLAVIKTNQYGLESSVSHLDDQIADDLAMEALLQGAVIGSSPPPLALAWRSRAESADRIKRPN